MNFDFLELHATANVLSELSQVLSTDLVVVKEEPQLFQATALSKPGAKFPEFVPGQLITIQVQSEACEL